MRVILWYYMIHFRLTVTPDFIFNISIISEFALGFSKQDS